MVEIANITLHNFGTTDFEKLKSTIDFQQRSVVVNGKIYPQPRLVKWYGPVNYHYSGLTWEPCEMPELLAEIRQRIETQLQLPFNSVLCNLYRNGNDTVGWHADDEKIFSGDPVVASLSFGATRTFSVKHKWDPTIRANFELEDGSLLVMGKGIQISFLHKIPRISKPVAERINLTFRQCKL